MADLGSISGTSYGLQSLPGVTSEHRVGLCQVCSLQGKKNPKYKASERQQNQVIAITGIQNEKDPGASDCFED